MLELIYVPDGPDDPPLNLAASVRVQSNFPLLLLEESDPYIEEVICKDDTIVSEYHDTEALAMIWNELQQYPELLVITSHAGCNPAGERRPFQ